MQREKISAFIVTFNEGKRLEECLRSVTFCDQIVVIDLGSKDDTLEILKRNRVEVYHRKRQPVVEIIRKENLHLIRNDWVIYIDPDEVFQEAVLGEINQLVKDDSVGLIGLPWRFYFKEKLISTSIWGSQKYKYALINKKKVLLSEDVHRGIVLKSRHVMKEIIWKEEYAIKHFWADSYHQLMEKHWRYIRNEGKSRYNHGQRFSITALVSETANALIRNLIEYKGIRGGWSGIFLSFFYCCYVFLSIISLANYQYSGKSGNEFSQKS